MLTQLNVSLCCAFSLSAEVEDGLTILTTAANNLPTCGGRQVLISGCRRYSCNSRHDVFTDKIHTAIETLPLRRQMEDVLCILLIVKQR